MSPSCPATPALSSARNTARPRPAAASSSRSGKEDHHEGREGHEGVWPLRALRVFVVKAFFKNWEGADAVCDRDPDRRRVMAGGAPRRGAGLRARLVLRHANAV